MGTPQCLAAPPGQARHGCRQRVRLPARPGDDQDAFARAGIDDVFEPDGIETHDCFTVSQYLAIDHFGIIKPGRSSEAADSGVTRRDGKLPVNPSGGLIGVGHPVGATGIRMMLDGYLQVTDQAEGYQVPNARRFATVNFGGSTATVVCTVISRASGA
ncbi:hypothetical protein ACFWFF_21175 [Streptomyces sp. NPDC060223]|uniref:thiolase C-terminal domain-containing protein n=1 Tax=unclassified Streptomyces TaxID=2593676 RepID=UPI003630F77A